MKNTNLLNEEINQIRKMMGLSLNENDNSMIDPTYTHFAILKSNGKIVNGWEYSDDLNTADIMYYCKFDMEDMDYKTSEYKIYTKEYLMKNGIDPFNPENWDKYNNETT